MEEWESDLNEIFQLLGQEILRYQQLIEVLKKESEYLRRGASESLMSVIKEVEYYTEMILSIEERVKEWVEKLFKRFSLKGGEPTLSTLYTIFPLATQRKIHSYQRFLWQLKEEVQQINDRNKAFIQEYLTFWTDLVSTLINPAIESQNYSYQKTTGNKSIFPSLPLTLNREV